jgi:hypothetical protein
MKPTKKILGYLLAVIAASQVSVKADGQFYSGSRHVFGGNLIPDNPGVRSLGTSAAPWSDVRADAATIANLTATAATLPAATEGAAGVVELATTGEASAGVDTERAVTAAGVAAAISSLGLPTAYDDYNASVAVSGTTTLAEIVAPPAGTYIVHAGFAVVDTVDSEELIGEIGLNGEAADVSVAITPGTGTNGEIVSWSIGGIVVADGILNIELRAIEAATNVTVKGCWLTALRVAD